MPASAAQQVRAAARFVRIAAPFGIAALCLWVLHERLGDMDLRGLWDAASQHSWMHWTGAFIATAVSIWAVGRYDTVAHRHLGTGVADAPGRRAGMCAIAFSQTVGFGVVTGSFARWRLIPGLSPVVAVKLTAFVALSFLTALALLIAGSFLFTPFNAAFDWISLLCLVLAGPLLAVAFFNPQIRVGRLSFRLPSLPAMWAILGWTLLDTVAACTALYLLIPNAADIGWHLVFHAYLIALGAALLSGTPGGVGPFELTFLALLPSAPDMDLMVGIMAFRLVYFAVPALIAGLVLLFPPRDVQEELDASPDRDLCPDRPRAETAIIDQNGGYVMRGDLSDMAVLETDQVLVGLFDPVCGGRKADLSLLQQEAKARNLRPCLYKCTASIATTARQAGWKVIRVSAEAVLDPMSFSTKGSKRRQLRRKLRQAEKAGLRLEQAGDILPFAEMARIDGRMAGCQWPRQRHHHGPVRARICCHPAGVPGLARGSSGRLRQPARRKPRMVSGSDAGGSHRPRRHHARADLRGARRGQGAQRAAPVAGRRDRSQVPPGGLWAGAVQA
jgi:phosphatidylglycerol lysyltransferase